MAPAYIDAAAFQFAYVAYQTDAGCGATAERVGRAEARQKGRGGGSNGFRVDSAKTKETQRSDPLKGLGVPHTLERPVDRAC